MRTSEHGSTPVPTEPNAFTAEYLELLARRDEPVTGAEADAAGPWHLERHPSGWAVLRQGQSLEKGSRPAAVFVHRDAARLCAAILPGTGRRLRYKMGQDPDGLLGFPLFDDGEVVAWLEFFNQDVLDALNVADALVSVPRDLAWVLDAAGGLALDHAGKIALQMGHEP